MLGLYNFRWIGANGEFNEYVGRVKEFADGIERASFKGVFLPTSEWNSVLVIEGSNFDKILEVYNAYLKKCGSHPKVPLAKLELLLTFKEFGYPT